MAARKQVCKQSGIEFTTKLTPVGDGYICHISYQIEGKQVVHEEHVTYKSEAGQAFRNMFRAIDKWFLGGCQLTGIIRDRMWNEDKYPP